MKNMSNKVFLQKLTYSLLLLVAFLIVSGVLMTARSLECNVSQPTALSVTFGEKVTFNMITGIPGVVVIILGFIGLLVLLKKVPIKEAFLVVESGDGKSNSMMLLLHKTVYVHYKIPIIFYWLFGKKMNLLKEE
jgi:hypothetical protein